MTRQFIDFGTLWKMQIPVPYSALVRDGDRAWSCGQLALDRGGQVRAPHDSEGQARIIAGNIDTILAEVGMGPADVSRLVLYCGANDMKARERAVAVLADAFGKDTLIETVPVPHFYYDGIVMEVDVFCAPSEPVQEGDLPGGGHVRTKRESGLVLMNLTAPVASLGLAVAGALRDNKLSPDQLLSGWGIAPEPLLSAVPGQIAPRLPGFFAGALMPCYRLDDRVHLYLTFGEGDLEIFEHRDKRVRLHLARAETLAVLDARYLGGGAIGIDAQTRVVMEGLEAMLTAHGMDFGDVVKSTTFYAGGNTAAELHANMKIRNRYYTVPGPASTGVPIARMADPGSKVRVELVLRPAS